MIPMNCVALISCLTHYGQQALPESVREHAAIVNVDLKPVQQS